MFCTFTTDYKIPHMTQAYDRASKWSILEYSKRLLNKTLEEAIVPNQIEEEFRGKGRLGQLVDELYCHSSLRK